MKKIFVIILLTLTTFIIPTENSGITDTVSNQVSMPEEYEGVHIVINKTKNTLTIFLNGNIIRVFRVATGKTSYLTPEGKFKIITKVKEPWYLPKKIPGGDKKNPLGTRWLGLSVPNTGGYKYGIHGTNNPYSIGRHVSLGCIRMHNRDVEWLYRHIPLKTDVIIKR